MVVNLVDIMIRICKNDRCYIDDGEECANGHQHASVSNDCADQRAGIIHHLPRLMDEMLIEARIETIKQRKEVIDMGRKREPYKTPFGCLVEEFFFDHWYLVFRNGELFYALRDGVQYTECEHKIEYLRGLPLGAA